jgi:acyl-CoA synthetase (AMP-forming)/AMP-acid ligase II
VSLVDVYDRLAAECPDEPARTFARPPYNDVVRTWRQVAGRSVELAERLGAARVPLAGRCAVVLADHPDLLPTLLAIWRNGGVVVPLDARWGDILTARIVNHSRAVVVLDVAADSMTPSGESGRVEAVGLPQGTAMISYTSGSTGDPKGVVLRHRHLLSAYQSGVGALVRLLGRAPGRFGCSMRMSGLGVLGMHYLWAAVVGAEVVVLPELTLSSARGYWAALAAHDVELTYLVPPLVELLNRAAAAPAEDAPRPVVLAGAAPLVPAVQRRFQERFGAVLLNAYGLTEASFAVFFGDRDASGRGTSSIGQPNTAAARVRGADGAVVEGPAEGELELAGPVVSDGYSDNPDATAALFRDGWLATGDLVRRDEHDRFWIVGRVKEAVMKGGFPVYLSEVEEAAAELPGVTEAAAVRLDLPSGEDVGLLVRTDGDGAVEAGALCIELERRLGRHRAPRRVVCVPHALPRVGQGKVDRRQALALWEALTRASNG